MKAPLHVPAMPEKVLAYLDIRADGTYVDMTIGPGGHSELILERVPQGFLIGIDRDEQALTMAQQRLARFEGRFRLFHGRYSQLAAVLEEAGFDRVDGALIDTGLSRDQLLDPARGFSFDSTAALDMRMDCSQELTAYQVVNNYSQEKLYQVLQRTDRRREARKLARRIVSFREGNGPIRTTAQLAEIIAAQMARQARRGKKRHPATLWLMAIRIEVNEELSELQSGLHAAAEALRPGSGRLVVLTWAGHEHGLVRRELRALQTPRTFGPPALLDKHERKPLVKYLTPKPLSADEDQIRHNPAVRTCRLHAAQAI